MLDKKYFFVSLLFHLFIIILFLLIERETRIYKHFLVLGVHSRKFTQAYFKPLKDYNKGKSYRPNIKKNINSSSKNVIKKSSPEKVISKKIINKKSTKNIVKKTKVIKKKQSVVKPIVKPIVKKQVVKNVKQKKRKKTKLEKKDVVNSKLLFYQKNIQKEVRRLWHPPVGVPKGTQCRVRFMISSSGNVFDFKIIRPSKILIYDLSIKRVAKKFNFDRLLWGRNFDVDFRQ